MRSPPTSQEQKPALWRHQIETLPHVLVGWGLVRARSVVNDQAATSVDGAIPEQA
jgi:hypothetical protein